MTLDACYQHVEALCQQRLPDDFHQRIVDNTQRVFAMRLQSVTNVTQVLDYLQQRSLPFCVASNGSLAKIAHSFDVTGLHVYFSENTIFSAQTMAAKPAPDVFLQAAETMGVPPELCWVVEDSLTGCTAAKRAGMHLLYFSEQLSQKVIDLTEPDAVMATMLDVQAFFVEKWGEVVI